MSEQQPKIAIVPEGIDFSSVLADLEGEPMTALDGKELTLGVCACQSLLATFEGERPDATEFYARFKLSRKIKKAMKKDGFLKINVTKMKMVDERISKAWGPLVYGQCHELIEGGVDEDDEDDE